MLRKACFTGFVHNTLEIRQRMPLHRTGGAMWVCNYSTAARTISVDWSSNGTVWTAVTLIAFNDEPIVPYGIKVYSLELPECYRDAGYIRFRLDARADGDGVFVQLESASPVPDYPLMGLAG